MAVELFGTTYLSLQSDPAFIALVNVGMTRFGSANPVSRLADYDFGPLLAAESELAENFGQEDACLFSSGYLAGVALRLQLQSITKRQGLPILVASDGHPSACCTLAMSSSSAMSDAIAARENAPTGWVAIFDSINSLLAQVTADPTTCRVIQDAILRAVDVSHTAFLWQDHHFLLGSAPTIFFGSLGKAAAFPAGFIAGPKIIIAELRQSALYSAASPPSNAFAYAFTKASALRLARRERLRKHLERIDLALGMERRDRWFPAYRLPDDDMLHTAFLAAGYKLSQLRYPTATSAPSLRAVIKANLDDADIDAFLELCQRHKVQPFQAGPASTWQVAGRDNYINIANEYVES